MPVRLVGPDATDGGSVLWGGRRPERGNRSGALTRGSRDGRYDARMSVLSRRWAGFVVVAAIVVIPVAAVLAIYARESGQGMIFTEEDARGDTAASGEPPEPPKPGSPGPGKRPRLKVIK